MLPDADLIIACPLCHAPARVFQIMSGNTMGAITWTDGWMDAPLLPRVPRITRCQTCRKIYWLAMAPELGFSGGTSAEDAPPVEDRWADAPHVEPLDEAACFEALRDGLGASPDGQAACLALIERNARQVVV